MSFIVPIPPNPADAQYKDNQPLFNARQMEWMSVLKGRLEQSKPLASGVAIQSPVGGDMAYYANGLGWSRFPAGAAGQVIVQGTSTAPTWGNINSLVAAGTNITITGTATATIALASNVINSFPARTAIAGTSYSIQAADYLVAYTTLGSAVTATLPSAIGLANRKFIVKDEFGGAGTNNITVATSTSAQKIDGTSTKVINTNYGDLRVYTEGTNYFTW